METTKKITGKCKTMIRFLMRVTGQDLIEYALLVAMISLGAVAAMTTLSKDINNAFTSIGTTLNTYVTSGGGGTTTGGQQGGGQQGGGQQGGGQQGGGQQGGGRGGFGGFGD
jgi:Flp pilus assembly pilin Flp